MAIDLHTHSIASGHGTCDTITDLARAAAEKGLSCIGISDHAPAMAGAARLSYFRSLPRLPAKRFGIFVLFGAELNILSEDGTLDLPDSLISSLDYSIASIHPHLYKGCTENCSIDSNTSACINAMKHPGVCIIGHPDDTHFPISPLHLVQAAKKYHVLPEINNASLSPEGYRGDCRPADSEILRLCAQLQVPVLIGSDSHGSGHIGDFSYARELMHALCFPAELIANDNIRLLRSYIPGLKKLSPSLF